MSLVFLIGMPGAGKTYWGKRWAGEGSFADLDHIIAQAENLTISEIFHRHGEAYFRERERYWLHRLMDELPAGAVIATGGGTPVFFDNMDRMKAAGCVVYLQATVTELAERLHLDPIERPLLDIGNTELRLSVLLGERDEIYRQAHIILPVTKLTDATFTQILSECTDRHL